MPETRQACHVTLHQNLQHTPPPPPPTPRRSTAKNLSTPDRLQQPVPVYSSQSPFTKYSYLKLLDFVQQVYFHFIGDVAQNLYTVIIVGKKTQEMISLSRALENSL